MSCSDSTNRPLYTTTKNYRQTAPVYNHHKNKKALRAVGRLEKNKSLRNNWAQCFFISSMLNNDQEVRASIQWWYLDPPWHTQRFRGMVCVSYRNSSSCRNPIVNKVTCNGLGWVKNAKFWGAQETKFFSMIIRMLIMLKHVDAKDLNVSFRFWVFLLSMHELYNGIPVGNTDHFPESLSMSRWVKISS